MYKTCVGFTLPVLGFQANCKRLNRDLPLVQVHQQIQIVPCFQLLQVLRRGQGSQNVPAVQPVHFLQLVLGVQEVPEVLLGLKQMQIL